MSNSTDDVAKVAQEVVTKTTDDTVKVAQKTVTKTTDDTAKVVQKTVSKTTDDTAKVAQKTVAKTTDDAVKVTQDAVSKTTDDVATTTQKTVSNKTGGAVKSARKLESVVPDEIAMRMEKAPSIDMNSNIYIRRVNNLKNGDIVIERVFQNGDMKTIRLDKNNKLVGEDIFSKKTNTGYSMSVEEDGSVARYIRTGFENNPLHDDIVICENIKNGKLKWKSISYSEKAAGKNYDEVFYNFCSDGTTQVTKERKGSDVLKYVIPAKKA